MKIFFKALLISLTLSACLWSVRDWDLSYKQLPSDGQECVDSWLSYPDAVLNTAAALQGLDFEIDEFLAVKLGVTNKSQYDFTAYIRANKKQYLLLNDGVKETADLHEIEENIFQQVRPRLAKIKKSTNKIIMGETTYSNHVYCSFYFYYDGKKQYKLAHIGYHEEEYNLSQILFKLKRNYAFEETLYQLKEYEDKLDIKANKQKIKDDIFLEFGGIK